MIRQLFEYRLFDNVMTSFLMYFSSATVNDKVDVQEVWGNLLTDIVSNHCDDIKLPVELKVFILPRARLERERTKVSRERKLKMLVVSEDNQRRGFQRDSLQYVQKVA